MGDNFIVPSLHRLQLEFRKNKFFCSALRKPKLQFKDQYIEESRKIYYLSDRCLLRTVIYKRLLNPERFLQQQAGSSSSTSTIDTLTQVKEFEYNYFREFTVIGSQYSTTGEDFFEAISAETYKSRTLTNLFNKENRAISNFIYFSRTPYSITTGIVQEFSFSEFDTDFSEESDYLSSEEEIDTNIVNNNSVIENPYVQD